MNNADQVLRSNQSGDEDQRVSVICTRPPEPGYSYPHINKIDADIVCDSKRRRECICRQCGMPLILDNRYMPINKLSEGGFGITFLSRDLQFLHPQGATSKEKIDGARRRVVKVFHPSTQLGPIKPAVYKDLTKYFEQEAHILCDLEHQYIPKVFGYFEIATPANYLEILSSQESSNEIDASAEERKLIYLYIVQGYIDGNDLDKELGSEGRLSESETKEFLEQVLRILSYIHNRGIVHRDIHPGNIILHNSKYYLIDFGAVKEKVKEKISILESSSNKSIGNTIGRTGYIDPSRRNSNYALTKSSDIYSLAAVCIRLLTGKEPTNSNLPHDLHGWKNDAQVSPEFAAILDKMLAQRLEDRYQSAEEVLQDLESPPPDPPPPDPPEPEPPDPPEPEPPPDPPEPEPPRSKLLIIAALVVGLLALIGGAWWIWDRLFREPALISAGDKPIADSVISLSGEYEELKQQGIKAFADGDYVTARDKFAEIRRRAKEEWDRQGANLDTPYGKALQDPTVLIYRNNAEVRLRHQSGQQIYRIAAPAPLNVNIGKEILFGIAQAQDQAVNPQNGKPPVNIEIVIANDLNNPDQAEAVAESLTEDTFDGQRILAVIGHYTSDNTCETLKNHYAPANIPVISPLSTAANIRQDCDKNGWSFRISSSTEVEANTLANYLTVQKENLKVAIFSSQSDRYSRSLFNQFQSILNSSGGEAFNFDLSDSSVDVEARLNQVKDEVDALAVFPDGRAGSDEPFQRAIEVIRASGGEKPIVGSAPLYTNEAAEQLTGLPNLKNNLILTTDWYQDCAPVFSEQVQSYWFGGVNRNAAHSYEAVQAVQATLTEGVTRDQIRQKLTEIQIPSGVFANKTISFDTNGNRIELDKRILTTLVDDAKKPFVLVEGQGCSAN